MNSARSDEIITIGDVACPTNALPKSTDSSTGASSQDKSYRPQM